ncbi:hypothetical protein EFL95_07580 [Nocardioides marmorisolisilvae]|uniref:CHAP domain-containing protein n=1 Tax=Nocardioides marmorisolisilvae TaxID=1542737 RepID=A0A3N0DTF9_9ACTN|nr:hypothetical protein EFL95_07580 [Nocardioides marmorisolisilvae]
MNRTSTLYQCTSTWYVCTATGSKGATTAASSNYADVICWEQGRTAYSQQKWFYVELDFGGSGFIPAPAVATAGADRSAPACSSVYRINAAQMALNRTDQTFIGASDAKLLASLGHPNDSSSAGTHGDWPGDCIGFAQLAWYLGGYGGVPGGDAIGSYNVYKSRGWVNKTGIPPRGALIYWAATSSNAYHGHVAVSLGNNMEVTTQGLDGQDNNNPIVIKAIPSGSLGWVMPLWN